MKRRVKLKKRASKKMFSRTASMTHKKNLYSNTNPMRGGIRL